MANFELRWAQLDVARQMETIDFIEKFIVLLAEAKYNGLLLYLEDRIRTASYPYPADNECYTPDEIRHLVEFAKGYNVEVIPCVATLGHAERFFRHKELEYMAELQGDMIGRFGGKDKKTFCVTHPDFYPFIGKYLQEVAELFPSGWFHVGLDEFWDYNMCERCKKAMPDLMAEQEMFLQHIIKIRDIMSACGKRIMMWSDMFEFYPDVFKKVPADVVMVDWQYQNDVRNYQGHLLDVGNEERLAVNAANGHDTIVAPADRTLHNYQSYLEYADGKPQVIGGLLTSWEKNDTFLYRTLAVYVAAGYQMAGCDRDEAVARMMKQLFGTDDPTLTAGVSVALSTWMIRHFSGVREPHLCTRDYYGIDAPQMEVDKAMRLIIEINRNKVTTELGQRCIDDILDALDEKIISARGHEVTQEIIDRGATPELMKRYKAFRDDFAAYLDRMEQRWMVYRSTITPNVFSQRKAGLLEALDKLEQKLRTNSWIRVACCLPDGYGVEHMLVEYKTSSGWHTATTGVFKAHSSDTALFSRYIALEETLDTPIEAVRLTAHGLGGVGVTFVEVCANSVRYVPENIPQLAGKVQEPLNLLDDDTRFSWFGSQHTRGDYFDKNAADQLHSITINMKKFEPNDIVFAK